MSVYEPPANSCTNSLGASSNSAYIGLFYSPGATVNITSPYVWEVAATAGVMAGAVNFSGTLPTITYGAGYAPVPVASRITS